MIIKIDEDGDEDDRDSGSDGSEESDFYDEGYLNNNNNSGNSNKKRNDKKIKKSKVTVNRNIKYKLPGASISDLFSSSYFFEYCNGKGLAQEECDLLKKVWKFVLLRDIHKDSLARVYMNNSKKQLAEAATAAAAAASSSGSPSPSTDYRYHPTINIRSIKQKIDSMIHKGVFVYGKKYSFIIINRNWLKDFEKSYENFIESIESEKVLAESCITVNKNNQQEKDSA